MRILVTGGAGYLGSTLVPRLLEKGHALRVLDNLCHGGKSLLGVWSHPRFEFRRGDVRGPEAREALRGIEAGGHFAAIVGDPACSPQPDLARAVNLQASLALFRASQESGVQRFTFASTCSNYGKMKDPDQYL